MSARISSLDPGASPDPAVNGILDCSQQGFHDTQMFVQFPTPKRWALRRWEFIAFYTRPTCLRPTATRSW
jgi:hypothetical protein